MVRHKILNRFVLCCAVGLIAGCNSKDWAYVDGTITLNGNPVGPGTIMFEPKSTADTRAPSGVGNFAEDGKFKIRSAGGRDGLPPGEYLVIIDGKSKESSGNENVAPTQNSEIPPKYVNANASGLTASLRPGDNTVDFDLKP